MQSSSRVFLAGAVGILIGVGSLPLALMPRSAVSTHARIAVAGPSGPQTMTAYATLPLSFEPNRGQTDPQVQFLARGPGYTLLLTPTEALLILQESQLERQKTKKVESRFPSFASFVSISPSEVEGSALSKQIALRMKFVGANPRPKVSALEEFPGKSNYFIGNDPAKWRTNIPHYSKVLYENVYSGVDLVYYGNQRQLEYDFIVAPGTDPGAIGLGIEGARHMELDAQGNLILHIDDGELRLHKPVLHQEVAGVRQEVAGRYVFRRGDEVSFEVAAYDASQPLIIDPVLVYSTYLGGSFDDSGEGLAVDGDGNVYLTGSTGSSNFPTTSGAFQPHQPISCPSVDCTDAYVTKLNANGATLIYSTYLGGTAFDAAEGIALDTAGNAYVTGQTFSTNFPTTAGTFQPAFAGTRDAFIAKLNASGSALVFSSYLGGGDLDMSHAIAVDSAGNAYVTGETRSPDFPTTTAAFDRTLGGSGDAFVTKLNPSGSALVYSTYLGGSGSEGPRGGTGIAVDAAGNAYVCGSTDSTDFPTATPFQASLAGVFDGFVTKLNPTGSALVYSTYLGGTGTSNDFIEQIALDPADSAYVTGRTWSADFPTTTGAFDVSCGTDGNCNAGQSDVFVTKFSAAGSTLVYSTYLGGSGSDQGGAIAVDAAGNAYVGGETGSVDFPIASPIQSTFGGGPFDGFVTKLNAAGSSLIYSTYLGGNGPFSEAAKSIAVDSAGNAYATGFTPSTDFPTVNPLQAVLGGGFDAFVAKITELPVFGISVSPVSGTVRAGQSATYTVTVTPEGGSFDKAISLGCSLPGTLTLASCSVAPSTVTPGVNAATSTLTVTTTAASAEAPREFSRPPQGPLKLPLYAFWLVVLALALLLSRRRLRLSLSLSGLCSVWFFIGCGGGGGQAPNQPRPGTPPGTYTITVTGTSASLQRSTTATLIVQ